MSNRRSDSFLHTCDGKEEGELSQSDEVETPCSLNAPISIPSPVGATSSTPLDHSSPVPGQGLNSSAPSFNLTGGSNSVSGRIMAKNQTQTSSILMNRGKSIPSLPRKDRDNLVISFSDDESERDSMEMKRPKIHSSDKQVQLSRQTQSSLPLHHHKPRTVTRHSKNATVIHAADSPSARRNRGTISNKGSIRAKRFNGTGSTHTVQEQSLDMLQDLRKKIALRERELKLKTMQLNKDYTSFSVRDTRNVQADANINTEKSIEMLLNESEKKRIKRTTANSPLPSCDGNRLIAQNLVILNNSTHPKNSKIGLPDSGMQNGGEAKRFLSSPGSNFRGASKNVSDGKEAQKINCSLNIQQEPVDTGERLPVIVHSAGNFMTNRPHKDVGQQTLDKPLEKTGFEGYDRGKMEKFGNLDIEALNTLEESLDIELEAAQVLRHKCELEERNALKAYRKAQKALVLANAKCQDFLRKRELFSSQWSSFLISDASLLQPSQSMTDPGASLCVQALHLIPSSQREKNVSNVADGDKDVICAQEAPASPPLPSKQNVEHEACNNSDSSASEPHENRNDDLTGLSYDSSAEEDNEIFEIDDEKDVSDNISHDRKNSHPSSNDAAVDSLILEAQLRSKLVTRLRTRDLSSKQDSSNTLSLPVDDYTEKVTAYITSFVTELLETESHTVDAPLSKFNEKREKDVGFLTGAAVIDPFWPLCMFELRGKCNNEKCSFQHLKQRGLHVCHGINTTDSQGGHETGIFPKSHNCHRESSPLYVVALDALKAERLPYNSAFVWRSEKFWHKCFTRCLCLSSALHADFPADNSIVNGVNGRIEVHGSWKTQALQYRQLILNNLSKDPSSNLDSVEMSLLSRSLDNGVAFFKKALSILARAVENDPQSELLWITYLLHCYSDVASIGKTDMFSHAVEHVNGSYVLWLMFINSRNVLEDRLAAYNSAIISLCRKIRDSKDDKFLSSCALDLFLQYLSFLLESGKVQEAIDSACSDTSFSPLLPDVISSLTFSDQLVLWICSAYLTIYRKLPAAILHCLECEKELLEIEWTPIYISPGETDRVIKMIDAALYSNQFYTREMYKENIEIMQQFAVSHVRCMAAIGCSGRSRQIIDLYSKMFPPCLDLILLIAKMTPTGFEDVLTKDFSGKNYAWHQYLDASMHKGRDLSLKLMARWYYSFPQNSYCHSDSSQIDVLFGHLNFAWLKILQGENDESLSAIDAAFKSGGKHQLKLFLKAAATILRDSSMKPSEIVSVLKGYLDEAWDTLSLVSMSAKCVTGSVSALVSPLSGDHRVLNSALVVLNGPDMVAKSGDLVGYAESVMEILPWNYEFALCLCRYIRREGIVAKSVVYWGCVNLVDALIGAVPVAPEYVWVEAASFIDHFHIGDIFFKRALSVFPFSFLLWRCFYHFRLPFGSAHPVAHAARQFGFSLS